MQYKFMPKVACKINRRLNGDNQTLLLQYKPTAISAGVAVGGRELNISIE